jgi:hypothetical protein
VRGSAPAWVWFLAAAIGAVAAVAGAFVGNVLSVILGLAWVTIGLTRGVKLRREEAERNG